MNQDLTLINVMAAGREAIHVLTLLSHQIDKLGREEDAELISASARDVAGVVLSIVNQMIPDTEDA